jgi:hypothetical protein
VLSHWSTLIENYDQSPRLFYELVARSVKKREIPNAVVSSRDLNEGGFFSSKRTYLTISFKKDFYFAVCAAPFGTGFFISYWLLQPPDGCLATLFKPFPLLSALGIAMTRPWTYYRADTITMFQTAVHSSIMESLDILTRESNIPQLTEGERKPVMKEFFAT